MISVAITFIYFVFCNYTFLHPCDCSLIVVLLARKKRIQKEFEYMFELSFFFDNCFFSSAVNLIKQIS